MFEREIMEFNEAMGDMITNMSHFDENLKLKLQLNLNLIEQDYRVWTQHDQDEEGDTNLQEVINQMKKVISVQMKDDCYLSDAEAFQMEKNSELIYVMESIRALMQKQSITWEVLQ